MVTIQDIKSITIEAKQSMFYENNKQCISIENIEIISLSEKEEKIFINCSVFLGGLDSLINCELVEFEKDNVSCLESIIPLVWFREWVAAISHQEDILPEEEINVFKYLFDITKTWKSKGCDLVCISGAKNVDQI